MPSSFCVASIISKETPGLFTFPGVFIPQKSHPVLGGSFHYSWFVFEKQCDIYELSIVLYVRSQNKWGGDLVEKTEVQRLFDDYAQEVFRLAFLSFWSNWIYKARVMFLGIIQSSGIISFFQSILRVLSRCMSHGKWSLVLHYVTVRCNYLRSSV